MEIRDVQERWSGFFGNPRRGHVDACETGTGTPAYQSARKWQVKRVLVDLGTDKVPFFPDVKNMKDLGLSILDDARVWYGHAEGRARRRSGSSWKMPSRR